MQNRQYQGQQRASSGFHPSLSSGGKIIMPEQFNAKAADIIVPGRSAGQSGIIHPDDLPEGMVRTGCGIVHPNREGPRRFYSLPSLSRPSIAPPVSDLKIAAPDAEKIENYHSLSTKAVIEDDGINAADPSRETGFMLRLRDGLAAEFDRRRKDLGFDPWSEAVQSAQNSGVKSDRFVDDIMSVTRSVAGNPRGPRH